MANGLRLWRGLAKGGQLGGVKGGFVFEHKTQTPCLVEKAAIGQWKGPADHHRRHQGLTRSNILFHQNFKRLRQVLQVGKPQGPHRPGIGHKPIQ